MPRQVNYSLVQIDPVYKDIWAKSIQQPVELRMKDRAEFQRLRFQLYHTRKALQAQGDPLFETIRNFSIQTSKEGDKHKMLIGPADEKIKNMLHKLGFGKDGVEEDLDPLLDPTAPEPEEDEK